MKKPLVAAVVVAVLLALSASCSNSKDLATKDPTTSPSTPSSPKVGSPPATTAPTTTAPTTAPPTTAADSGDRLSGSGFSIVIPNNWEDITSSLKANNPRLDIAIGEKNASTFRTNFNVVLATPTSATIPKDSAALGQEAATELKTLTHKPVTPLPDKTIDGAAAIGQTSTFVPSGASGISVTFLQYIVIHDGSAYPVTMTFATSNTAVAKQLLTSVLGSWKWAA